MWFWGLVFEKTEADSKRERETEGRETTCRSVEQRATSIDFIRANALLLFRRRVSRNTDFKREEEFRFGLFPHATTRSLVVARVWRESRLPLNFTQTDRRLFPLVFQASTFQLFLPPPVEKEKPRGKILWRAVESTAHGKSALYIHDPG